MLIVHWTHKVKLKFFIKLSKNFRFSQYHRLWSIAWKPKFRPKITIFDVVKTLFRFLLLSYLLPKVLKLIDLIKNRHIAIKTIDLILVQNILFFNFLFSKFHIFFRNLTLLTKCIFSHNFEQKRQFRLKTPLWYLIARIIQNFDCKRSSFWSIDDV